MIKKRFISLGLILLFFMLYFAASLLSIVPAGIFLAFGGAMTRSRYIQITLLSDAIFIYLALRFSYSVLRIKQEDLWLSSGKEKSYLKGYLVGILLFLLLIGMSLLFKQYGFIGYGKMTTLNLFLFIPAFAVHSFKEEIFVRGLLQRVVKDNFGIVASILLPSIVFAGLYLGKPGISLLSFANLYLFGVLASLMVYVTDSLWYAAGVHAAWKYVQGAIFGLPVSGLNLKWTLLKFETIGTQELFTGGRFGPMGSIFSTAILLLGIAYFYRKYKQKQLDEVMYEKNMD